MNIKMILEIKNKRLNAFNISPVQWNFEVEFTRKEIHYENLSERFICVKKDFKKQFAHIYSGRLMKMKERVIRSCSLKWGHALPVRKLSELSDETSEKCIIIGTLFKHQELKPSVLKEISEENQVMPQPIKSNFVSDGDQLILEDEFGRIKLIGSFNAKKFVTGVVVGVLGFENQEGKFEVEDICYAEPILNMERPLMVLEDSFLIMISGLNIGDANSAMALELLVDSIKGNLGFVSDQEMWANVTRVLLAGNSVTSSHSASDSNTINLETKEGLNILSAVKQLDKVFLDLVKSIEIDLMPGEHDLTNHMLPQQAIYDCVFPKASQYESFHCVTNPYEFKLGGRRILGSSGQPINNIKAFTDYDEPLEILEKTLLWSHLAPTAPDTLDCYPYYKDDPFIISELPDIYFVGNQPEFSCKLVSQNGHKTKIICIPAFSKTQTCITVNLRTLECTPVTFTT